MRRVPVVVALIAIFIVYPGFASAQNSDEHSMSFFLTSVNIGKGANLGGLTGADAHCQSLAEAAGAGGRIWRAYLSTSTVNARDSVLDLVKKNHNVIVCRTFSKIHGLAGMRIGYSIARPDISERITAHKMCKFMGPLASVAASVSLEQTEFHDFCRASAKSGRQLTFGLCEKLGLEYARGAGNFVFFNPGMPHEEFKLRMQVKGVSTARPFPPRKDWARVTMGTAEEMKIFAKVLPEVIAG